MIYEIVCVRSWVVHGSFDDPHDAREAYESMLTEGEIEELSLFEFEELREPGAAAPPDGSTSAHRV
jgi:hypothetical protein